MPLDLRCQIIELNERRKERPEKITGKTTHWNILLSSTLTPKQHYLFSYNSMADHVLFLSAQRV